MIAEEARQAFHLKKVLFVPSYITPNKDVCGATAEQRLAMTRLATADNPYFTVSDMEMRRRGNCVMEDAGRGWRQVVASPKPLAVVELTTIRALAEADNVVIACGGGGIPVIATDHHHLKGAAAVIDKDLASELLAEHLDADMLIILTAVEKVAVNFNKPNQKWLDTLTPEEARTYIGEGQFAPGSMLPKVEAAVKFAESKPGRTALITLLEKARDGIDGKTGTRITC